MSKKIEAKNITESFEGKNIVLGSMEIPNDVNIMSAIVNILDKGGDEPILNEYELELTEDTYKYIYKHIEKCFKNDKLKFGKFNPQLNTIKDICRNAITGKEDLINASKKISNFLFNILSSSDATSSCDLITSIISTDKGYMLAILKLDYLSGFMHEINFEDEKMKIGITPVKTGLPCGTQKVKKAAFIVPTNDKGYDLLYLDEVNKKSEEDCDIGFWSGQFLNCEEVKSIKKDTTDFLKATENWTRLTRFDNAADSEHIRSVVRNTLTEDMTTSINIDELAENIFDNDDTHYVDFMEYMNKHGFENEIVIDKPTALKKLSKVKIQVDKDISLSMDITAYNNPDKFAIKKNPDGSIDMVIKNVKSYIEK